MKTKCLNTNIVSKATGGKLEEEEEEEEEERERERESNEPIQDLKQRREKTEI